MGYILFIGFRSLRQESGVSEEDGIPDVEEEVQEDEEVINETMFTFEAFESVRIVGL